MSGFDPECWRGWRPWLKRVVARRGFAGLVAFATGALAVSVAGQASGLAAEAVATTCKNPTAQPPSPGHINALTGVAATSRCKAWAVGFYGRSPNFRTLIERWNGRAWKVQRSPDVGVLVGVAATSSTNAWAVGSRAILHWDGKAWKVQKSLKRGALSAVAATSSTNAWVVGDYGKVSSKRTLILHWKGAAWKVQHSPNPTSTDYLDGVAATSSTNAWAVGNYCILHWDGRAWKVQQTTNPGPLFAVTATSSTNAWAVGFNNSQTLIERWNGKVWKIQNSPSKRFNDNELHAVAAASSTDAWAVGYYYNRRTSRRLIERWNGTAWTILKSPNPAGSSPTDSNYFFGVAATSRTNAWAVGMYGYGTLALRWNGNSWRP